MSMPFIANPQAAADKEARRLCRLAYKTGGKVPYGLSRLLELKLSLKVVRAIYRGPAEEIKAPVRTVNLLMVAAVLLAGVAAVFLK